MSTLKHIPYSGSTPGADTDTYTLFDGTTIPGFPVNTDKTYRLTLNNSHLGTLKIYYAVSKSATPVLVEQFAVQAATATQLNHFVVDISAYKFVQVKWTNGGSAQTTWTVQQTLSDEPKQISAHVESSARVKAPVTSATTNFAAQIGTTHAVYAVASTWPGRRVSVTCRGASGAAATVWVLFGTADTVEVNRAAFVTGTPPAWTGSATIGRPIRDGETVDWFVPSNMTHVALEADTANTEVTILPTDFAPGEV